MLTCCRVWVLFLAFVASDADALNALEAAPQTTLKCGFAAVDITPRLGTPMAGYYSARGAEGVHDPLLAKAMVIDDGATKLAIVSLVAPQAPARSLSIMFRIC